MNYSIIIYILGWILKISSALMCLPAITSIIYKESSGFAFVITMVLCLILGTFITRRKPSNEVFHTREGYVAVALSWITLSLVGAFPFWISGTIPNPIDALFETVSGFTTTGASILLDVEVLPNCMLIWRSFTHWIGGMGVLVFILCLMPLTGGYQMSLMKAESPGPSVSRLVPRVRTTAIILYKIYMVMTLVQMGLLILGGCPLFDTICIAFGTAGTGGFGTKGDSIAGYNTYIQVVTTVFMLLFGINFNAYYLLISKKWKAAVLMEELRYYFMIVVGAILIITFNVRHLFPTIFSAFHHTSFQVASIITTTGFSTKDFDLWPSLSKTVLVTLMFIGACAGSTGGGFKVSRIVILVKYVFKEIQLLLHPSAIKKVKMDGKVIPHETVRTTNIFLTVYLMIFIVSVFLVSIEGKDLITNFTAVAATFNNIGPGLATVGPALNFAHLSWFSKCVLIFDMLAGRLEIFPLLVLCSYRTWKSF